MTTSYNYLAIDLGAESGRAITASLMGDQLVLNEVHRFGNGPVRLNDGIHWDVLRLWQEIKTGIAAAIQANRTVECIGLDTWGVDFALLDKHRSLLSNPFHYRDARTDEMLAEAFGRMPRAEIFANTGIQFMQINTLYQLLSMALQKSTLLEAAETFVTIPDLFNYWLSGEITNEFTNATTTQCFNPVLRNWAWPVLGAMDIPTRLFKQVTEPGTCLGRLDPQIAQETGAKDLHVVLPACHDTGSAVVAIPAINEDFAWISSGTWSIMGVEAQQPCLNDKALAYNFTNEGGVFGTWRLSKNVMGLWLVQECKRFWAQQGETLSYDELIALATAAKPFIAVIDLDDERFLHAGDMPARIRSYCSETNQTVPATKGEIVRVALESLALKYRWVLERLEELENKHFTSIHIIGGGTKNRLLNQFTADVTRRVVVTGPVEATAIGNVLMQAIGLGQLGSLAEARAVVRTSFEVEEYQPAGRGGWDESLEKLVQLLRSGEVTN
jgi:rhamnulokinase